MYEEIVDPDTSTLSCIKHTTVDGVVRFIPLDDRNFDYAAYLTWKAGQS